MIIENVKEKLEKLEKKLFFAKTVLLDTANIILKYGIQGYLSLVQQIKTHNPKRVIGKMDASARYRIKEKFGKEAYKEINKLIEEGEIECTPSRSECDVYLIQANIMISDSVVLSNDSFNDFNPFWTMALNVIKFLKIESRFYFNLDLRGAIEEMGALSNSHLKTEETAGIERLWGENKSVGEIELFPEEGVN